MITQVSVKEWLKYEGNKHTEQFKLQNAIPSKGVCRKRIKKLLPFKIAFDEKFAFKVDRKRLVESMKINFGILLHDDVKVATNTLVT